MSGFQEEDEWEKVEAELRIQDLQVSRLEEQMQQQQRRPSLVLPDHMQLKPSFESEFNFFSDDDFHRQDNASQMNIGSVYFPSNNGTTMTNPLVPIEDTLIDALNSNKERMNALRIEKDIYDFVLSGYPYMELSTLNNSFKRLLAYKIAQRFNLDHKSSEFLNEFGERSVLVTVFRTPSACIPHPLLIDASSSSHSSSSSPPPPFQSTAAPSTAKMAVSQNPPRVLLMKRNSKLDSAESRNAERKSAPTAEDKERKYLEARARIFGESAAGVEEGDAGLGSFVNDSTTIARVKSPAASPLPDSSLSPREEARSSSAIERSLSEADRPRRGISSSNSKRSLMRNKDLEMADPDFARRSALVHGVYTPPSIGQPVYAYPPYEQIPVAGYQQTSVVYGHYQAGYEDHYGGQSGNPYYNTSPHNPYYATFSYQQPSQSEDKSSQRPQPRSSYGGEDFPPLS